MELKKIDEYKNLKQYIQLNDVNKTIFDFLYPILLRQGYITDTNEQLLYVLKNYVPFKNERSLREHLVVLIEAGLIERVVETSIQYGKRTNIRYLYLNKYTFADETNFIRPTDKKVVQSYE